MSMKTQALRAEAQRGKYVPTIYSGNKVGGEGAALRYIVGRALDPQLLHTAAQGIRVQFE
jgi:hypothetical protein